MTGKSNKPHMSTAGNTTKVVPGNQPHSLPATQVCQLACIVLNLLWF